jgi:hypothetical protein
MLLSAANLETREIACAQTALQLVVNDISIVLVNTSNYKLKDFLIMIMITYIGKFHV